MILSVHEKRFFNWKSNKTSLLEDDFSSIEEGDIMDVSMFMDIAQMGVYYADN